MAPFFGEILLVKPLPPEGNTGRSRLVAKMKAKDGSITYREFQFTLIARALAALEAEHSTRPDHFATLKPWLSGGTDQPQVEAAAALGLSPTAVKVAIHRLRVRFRELIRNEIAATVHDPTEVADELRHLIAIAARG
ncbi:MAG: hypothetical protein K9N23_09660 [Akkermansiaceae bacterium]|nr:hypothetical protein [Akkermansiaceae bacterium]